MLKAIEAFIGGFLNRLYGRPHDRPRGFCETCKRHTNEGGSCAGSLADEMDSYERRIRELMWLRRKALERHGMPVDRIYADHSRPN